MENEICVVVGTRPGIIMMAPIIHELQNSNTPHYVVHTGQHYSPEMDSELFEDLHLTPAAYHLSGVAEAATHGTKTAKMLVGCEEVFLARRPALVIVNGDANTNLAAALAARKIGVPLAHSEAGERSYDWRMPEEHNRRIMDHISELLFATNEKARKILEGEKVPGEIFVTGNTIVDASINHAALAKTKSDILEKYGIDRENYILMTSHREENVDYPEHLEAIIKGAKLGAQKLGMQVIFPVHPRTLKNLKAFNLMHVADDPKHIRLLPAMRYIDFMQLLVNARLVITDSGGVQQEAFIHERPCVTVRNNTEWVETVEKRGNRIAGASDPNHIAQAIAEAFGETDFDWAPIFGDGKSAQRIVQRSLEFIETRQVR